MWYISLESSTRCTEQLEYLVFLLEETQHRCCLVYEGVWMRYWKTWYSQICLRKTVIAFCVINKVDYLIADLQTQTFLPCISQYPYLHVYEINEIKYRHLPVIKEKDIQNIMLNVRLIITFLKSSDKWLEIQEECLAGTGVIRNTNRPQKAMRKSEKKYKYYLSRVLSAITVMEKVDRKISAATSYYVQKSKTAYFQKVNRFLWQKTAKPVTKHLYH